MDDPIEDVARANDFAESEQTGSSTKRPSSAGGRSAATVIDNAARAPVKKSKPKAQSTDLVRLNVNLTQDSAETLKRTTSAKGISYTDAVRRALAITDLIDHQILNGRSIQAVGIDGQIRELIFL
jgi:hypothetical protein